MSGNIDPAPLRTAGEYLKTIRTTEAASCGNPDDENAPHANTFAVQEAKNEKGQGKSERAWEQNVIPLLIR